ncbi:MAG: SDR family oxidoreductase [Propioniciclava sp.]
MSTADLTLVVGASGIAGQATVRHLVDQGRPVIGLSRGNNPLPPGVSGVQADLMDPESLRTALAEVRPTGVVFTAWMRQDTEAENIAVNSATVRNLLAALSDAGSVRHVSLMTGLKHYMGPFEAYGTGLVAETPFRESEPRLPGPNFYYAQEDEVFAAAARDGFSWSVHRSHTVFGYATGNAMNMALTLGAYAAICRQTGAPFVFPGSAMQWNGLTDVTDADLLAEQMVWALDAEPAQNEAFNIANGDVFRWRWMWPRIAELLGVEAEGFQDQPRPLDPRLTGLDAQVWPTIAREHHLVQGDIGRLASWWHTDADLGRDLECLTDMTKSRQAGFLGFRDSFESFRGAIEAYRAAGVLPRV